MARKTAIRTDNATERAAEQKADERRDAAAAAAARERARHWLPTLAETRDAAARLDERELLSVCRSASRLEFRGVNYSPDDRADAAAEMMRRALLDNGGRTPRRTDERATLTHYCGEARNLRRSLDRQRERDAAAVQRDRDAAAMSERALGIDPPPARLVPVLAHLSEQTAERATEAVLDLLLPAPLGSIAATYPAAQRARIAVLHPADSPVWLALYRWATNETAERVAARRSIGVKLAEKRIAAGAKFLRGFFTAEQLADALTLGSRRAADGSLTLTVEDFSREAPHRWAADVAEHWQRPVCWREGTDNGRRPDRPEDRAAARSVCTTSRQNVRPKRERERAKGDAAAQLEQRAAALTRLAAEHARSGARERSAAAKSDVARGAVNHPTGA